jgi:hypothetical protein
MQLTCGDSAFRWTRNRQIRVERRFAFDLSVRERACEYMSRARKGRKHSDARAGAGARGRDQRSEHAHTHTYSNTRPPLSLTQRLYVAPLIKGHSLNPLICGQSHTPDVIFWHESTIPIIPLSHHPSCSCISVTLTKAKPQWLSLQISRARAP